VRTLVVGAGVSGRAASALAAALGDEVMIYDRNPEAVTRAATSFPTASGEWSPELLARAERVVVSPGVPQHAPEVRDALAEGIPVISEVELAASVARAPIVAVTGTNGKTTVTSLIAEMLITAGRKAVATGNIGTAFAEVALGEWDVFVVEVSSFQLRFTERFHPRVAVLLNIAEDHLDWHGTLQAYSAAKSRIFQNQDVNDLLIYDIDDPGATAAVAGAPSQLTPVSGVRLPPGGAGPDGDRLMTPGGGLALPQRTDPSFIVDVAAAAVAAAWFGTGLAPLAEVIAAFKPGPHRRALVGRWDGVDWVDDSKATNPHAALAAVAAYPSVILIAGGRNKGLDLAPLVRAPTVKHVVAIGEATEALVAAGGSGQVSPADSMPAAVAAAGALAAPGDTVLLAPGCASFDMFESYAARGDAFAADALAYHSADRSR
jgi:UDP-N-acetylmuramoylalanine--D-glutamate ligase